jgi:hypothetical protein
MVYQKLFLQGHCYLDYLAQGSKEEQQAVAGVTAKITQQIAEIGLPPELQKKLANIKSSINLLMVGEMWCPDCQLNITAIEQLTLLQPKIKLAIIGKELAERYLLQALNIETIKIPLVVILNSHYQKVGTFVERPETVLNYQYFSEIKKAYFVGDYLIDTMAEIINKFTV